MFTATWLFNLFLVKLFLSPERCVLSARIVNFTATLFGHVPTITNDTVSLILTVEDCSPVCSCHVQTNKTGALVAAQFIPTNSSRGLVNVKQLQPYTMYAFEANCSNATQTMMFAIRTDVSRPSAPRNASIALISHQLQLTWLPPKQPDGPIDEYRVAVDGNAMPRVLDNTLLYYRLNQSYTVDKKHTITVSACNKDTQNRTLCSDPKQAQVTLSGNKNDSYVIPTQSASVGRVSSALLVLVPVLLFVDCH